MADLVVADLVVAAVLVAPGAHPPWARRNRTGPLEAALAARPVAHLLGADRILAVPAAVCLPEIVLLEAPLGHLPEFVQNLAVLHAVHLH